MTVSAGIRSSHAARANASRFALGRGCPVILTLSCACAASRPPSVEPLCGTWAEGEPGIYESWTRDGDDLRGEGGKVLDDGQLVHSEGLWLRAGRRGHVYVAQPGHVEPTEFRPIVPDRARFGVETPAAATVWVWANYDHDFPQEIHYALVGDRLDVAIAGPEDGGGRSMGWTLQRVAACGELGPTAGGEA
jgi:hypothetical protein